VLVGNRGAFIGSKFHGNVPLGKYIDKLAEKFK
jgi:hypothetical protein